MELSRRVALVTGGGTGIGLEIARQLKARGNEVIICGRRAELIDRALLSVPGLRGLACDIGRDDGISRILEYVRERQLNIDVLVNNAGVQVQADLTDEKDDSLAALE